MSRALILLAEIVTFCHGPMLLYTCTREFLLFSQEHSSAYIDEAKRSLYRAANAIFGKIGRLASEEVYTPSIKDQMYSCSSLWTWGYSIE